MNFFIECSVTKGSFLGVLSFDEAIVMPFQLIREFFEFPSAFTGFFGF